MPPAQPEAKPISAAVRQQAIAWYSLTQSGDISADEILQLQHWRQADSEHERAWQRMAGLPALIHDNASLLRDPVARTALQQTRYAHNDRRRILKLLVSASLLGAVGWQSRDSHWVQGSMADLRTATGERRRELLADGSQLWLNTDTAVDVVFTRKERRIQLRYGEINVATAQDPAGRPLVVQTSNAELCPLGTRFTVCCDDDNAGTGLSVSSGRVAATLLPSFAAQVVEAGERARLAGGRIVISQASAADDAWVDGFVIAKAMRLGDLVRQLNRYRPGILRCDPRVAGLRVTGSYPLNDNDRILGLLENSLPVRIERRTAYWVTVLPLAAS